jgi:hypothetical protein
MMNAITLQKTTFKMKTLIVAAAVILSIVLPQIFHAIGVFFGVGTAPGAAFLPMHIPVLLAGLIAGPFAGLAAGILSPLCSSALTGMPGSAMLPFMVLELAGYGFTSGMMSRIKMPVFFKLLISQIAGRALRAGAVLFAIFILGSHMDVSIIRSFVIAGLPGILLQWVLIPLIMHRIQKGTADND